MDRGSDIAASFRGSRFRSVADLSIVEGSISLDGDRVSARVVYAGVAYRAVVFTIENDEYCSWRAMFTSIKEFSSSPFAQMEYLSGELLLPYGDGVDLFLIRDDYRPVGSDNRYVNNLMRWIERSPIVIENLSNGLLGEDSKGKAVICDIEHLDMHFEVDGKSISSESVYEIQDDYLSGYFCSDRFTPIGSWCEGRIVMVDSSSGLLGVVSDSQEAITDFIYSDITDYYECHAAVKLNERWGVIDRSGSFVITAEFEDIELMWEVNHIKYKQSGLYGIFARDLSIISDAQYRYIGSFSSGLAVVEFKSGGHNYIDIYGDLIDDKLYSEAKPFVDGLARVSLDGREYIIDRDGVEVHISLL